MLRKATTAAIYSNFLLAPTVAGIFLPLSFNRKLTTGGVLVLLGGFLLLAGNVKYRREHSILLGYAGINIFYALVAYAMFENSAVLGEVVLKTLVTSLAAMSTAWLIYKGMLITEASLHRCIHFFSAGVAATSLVVLGYAATLGITNAYSFRDDLYKNIYAAQTYFGDVDISALSFSEKLFFGSFMTFGGTAAIGPLLSLCSTVLLGYYLYGQGRKWDLIALFSGLASLAALFTTASRSALLSFGVSTLLTMAITASKAGRAALLTRRMLAAVYSISAGTVVMMLGFGSSLFEIAISSFSRMDVESMSKTARLPLWDGALQLSAMNPIGFGYEYVRLVHLLKDGVFPEEVQLGENHLHNFYLTNLNEFGLVGIAVFLALMAMIFRSAIRNIVAYRETREFPVAVAMLAGLIASATHMMFATMLLRSEAIYGATFWSMVAIVLVMSFRLGAAGGAGKGA